MGWLLGMLFDAAMVSGAMEAEKRYPRAWIFTKLIPAILIVGGLVLIGIFNGWS